METKRPVFLDPLKIHLPVGGWVSILHRVTGLVLLLCLPVLLYGLQLSLSGPEGFAAVRAVLDTAPARALLVVLLWAFAHHFFAGIRHLLLDAGIGLERAAARAGAWIALGGGLTVAALGAWVLLS